jgi:hypothetical protein
MRKDRCRWHVAGWTFADTRGGLDLLNDFPLENYDFIEHAIVGRTRHNLAVLSTGLRHVGVEHVESTESGMWDSNPAAP